MDKNKPVSATIGSDVTTIAEAKVVLTCVATGIPEPSISWMRGQQQLSSHDGIILARNNTSLTLISVTTGDTGLYTCVAANIAGTSTEELSLTVTGWSNFSNLLVFSTPNLCSLLNAESFAQLFLDCEAHLLTLLR